MSDSLQTGFDGVAHDLGLSIEEKPEPISSFWGHLPTADIGPAIIDRVTRFRQWQNESGLLRGWRLKLHYYYNEYRAGPEIPHLSIMQQWGSQGEYSFLSVNHLRSLLKTVLASVVQNPPAFQPTAVNSDADSGEAAALFQGVLDYYTRDLRLTSKINKAVEIGLVVDQSFLSVEWDYFATDGADTPSPSIIWKGAPSVKVLYPWDVVYDPLKTSWADQDYVIVRDWQDRERVKAQFPELADEIEGCRSRGEVEMSGSEVETPSRYNMTSFSDISNDIQIFKLYFRSQPWMPKGRFVMVLENGTVLFESPVGLLYPRLPVERFVCDEQVDILLGYSPINELLAPQEAVNSLVSAIQTNTNNYANQFIAVQAGTELNPKTLADGQKVIEYPPGAHPPVGLNLTAIPEVLFSHLKELMSMMQEIPSVSNSSRGQAPGANSTGSAMLFLSSQTTANQGSMSANYSEFAANVMTSLLHVLRVFGRTEKTISIMGQTVASKTIVLAEALKDFDEVVVSMTNPLMSTPQGKMAFAQQMLQFGNSTPAEALQVATSGNLGAATDPVREVQYELAKENEWLIDGQQIMVNALDDHQSHVLKHTRLLSTPWLRNPALAEKLNMTNAPQIQQVIQQHIQQHMQFMAGNAGNATAIAGAQPPGAAPQAPNPVLTGQHPQMPSAAAPINAPAQAGAQMAGTHLPNPPGQPMTPK